MTYWPAGMKTDPIGEWPGERTLRPTRSPFSAGIGTTVAELDREMRAIRATNVRLQIDLAPGKFRLDGMPRSDATPASPGLILTFETKVGAQSFPCDAFARWEDNLRAIVLSLEALRKVDRYGVTKRGEQYRGFLAIEGGTAMPAAWTFSTATRFIWETARENITKDNPLSAREVIRMAKRNAHPDTGGDAEVFQRVVSAERFLNESGADR